MIWRKFTGEKNGIRIVINKKFPLEAGLGGGSSDAVAALLGLNAMMKVPLSQKELIYIAAQIGSDCPSFLLSGLCVATGRGEDIRNVASARIREIKGRNLLLFKPPIGFSTRFTYDDLARKKKYSKRNNISIFLLSDLLSITAPVGLFLGRISNFLNQELIGRPTEFFLSISYPNEDIYRHISQIYEAIFEGLIPAILLLIIFYKFKIKNGLITSIFLINYGLSRIIIENFREPDFQLGLKFDFISQGQILSVPIVILGFIFLYLCQYKQR